MKFLSCFNITPKQEYEASQQTMKSLPSTGNARIGAVAKTVLRFWKISSHYSIPPSGTSFFVRLFK